MKAMNAVNKQFNYRQKKFDTLKKKTDPVSRYQ